MQPDNIRNIKALAYLKLGRHRGARRIWIEGEKLERAGFSIDERISLIPDRENKTLTVKVSDSGSNKISSKKARNSDNRIPVLDIGNKALSYLFDDSIERVKTVITTHTIIFSIHPHDEMAAERYARLVAKMSRYEPLAIGSVSHGGGILDHAVHTGLAESGVNTRLAWAIEIEHKYLEASLLNNPVWDANSIPVHAPMEEVEPELLPKVEIYMGGIPCTGASKSGMAKNKLSFAEDHQSAGALFHAFLTLLKRANPSIVILENVPSYQNTASMSVIRSVLDTLGYDIHETILSGNKMGALENRERLCVVAVTKGLKLDLNQLRPRRRKEETLGEILEPLSLDDERYRDYGYLDKKAAKDKAAGKGFKQQILGPESETVGVMGRGYSKARSTEPFVAHPEDSVKKRLLTVTEQAKAQTIPPELVEGLSDTVAREIMGQSVTHSAFVAVGALLGEVLANVYETGEKDVIEADGQQSLNLDESYQPEPLPREREDQMPKVIRSAMVSQRNRMK